MRDDFRYWDLGEEWEGLAKLPFVYALWLIRPEVIDAKIIADQLRRLRDKNLANIDKLIAEEKEFRSRILLPAITEKTCDSSFGKEEKKGLTRVPKRMRKTRTAAKARHRFGRRLGQRGRIGSHLGWRYAA